ncbi:hypothetical protein O181_000608 [Austropuccinia psidii MF-1]|uniref:Uncharacterized protein n=1 Tax=Austropuccinia psidii MF-1 TaxID=1389203 RepID=A0A9Q3B8U7_9BASI|nr:hypothetical protein [Austropuccinia psidii MF-1]
MSLFNSPPNTPQTLPPPSLIKFDMNNPPTQVQSISPTLPSELTCLSCEEFSLNHHHIKKIFNNSLSESESNPVSIEIKNYLKKGLTSVSQKEHELSSSQAIGLIDGNVEVTEREVASIFSAQSSLLEEVVPDRNHKKKPKIQNKPPPNICSFMQKTVNFNNTQEVVSMNMSSTKSTLCTNPTPPQSNDLPYSLPSTIVKPPVPSNFPLETTTTPPIITEEEIPNPSIPKHPPNVTPADLYKMNLLILTMTNLSKYQPVAYTILQLSPNVPSNATTPHVVLSPMQINLAKSSHTLSAPHFYNPKNNLLPSQSNPPTPSNAPTPGIRDQSNNLSPLGPSPPIFHETHQNPPSSLIPPESQPLESPNDQLSIFTDEFQSKYFELFKTFTHGGPTQAKYQKTFEAIDSLVSWRHQNLGSKQPAKGKFNFKQCSSSYTKWIDKLCDNIWFEIIPLQ